MPSSILRARPEEDNAAADAELAARIASGPGFWTDWLAELDRQGLLEELLVSGAVARALQEAPAGHRYDRTLTAKMTVGACWSRACSPAPAMTACSLRVRPAGGESQAGRGYPTVAASSQARKRSVSRS